MPNLPKLLTFPASLGLLVAASLAVAAPAGAADEYEFAPAPQIDLNLLYRVNRLTGEVGACQYAIKDGTIGVTLCRPPGDGAGPQQAPGDYGLVASKHEREAGVFRVNRRTGEISVCYVLADKVVCTPSAR